MEGVFRTQEGRTPHPPCRALEAVQEMSGCPATQRCWIPDGMDVRAGVLDGDFPSRRNPIPGVPKYRYLAPQTAPLVPQRLPRLGHLNGFWRDLAGGHRVPFCLALPNIQTKLPCGPLPPGELVSGLNILLLVADLLSSPFPKGSSRDLTSSLRSPLSPFPRRTRCYSHSQLLRFASQDSSKRCFHEHPASAEGKSHGPAISQASQTATRIALRNSQQPLTGRTEKTEEIS